MRCTWLLKYTTNCRCASRNAADRPVRSRPCNADSTLAPPSCLSQPHQAPGEDPYATLVYATRPTDVRTTIVDGEVLVSEGAPVRWDPHEVALTARAQARALLHRAGI